MASASSISAKAGHTIGSSLIRYESSPTDPAKPSGGNVGEMGKQFSGDDLLLGHGHQCFAVVRICAALRPFD